MIDDGDSEVPAIPTLLSVATPPHMLYVPWQLWAVSLGLLMGLGGLVGGAIGGGLRLEFALPVILPLHAWFAWRYRRDPHVWGVWRARFTAKPVPGLFGRRHRFGLPGRIRFSP